MSETRRRLILPKGLARTRRPDWTAAASRVSHNGTTLVLRTLFRPRPESGKFDDRVRPG
jgi:hypothetical protein